ncbi:hypothetical protein PUR34_31395 [Streptomyces sp. JV185]|nr:hypothetical protein [Streptomyces sp. JV185]MEE1772541.1 hypothetical protein [Streptomyces sp. JV185]
MSDAGAPVPAPEQADGMASAILHTLFAQSAVGLHVLDARLRVIRANVL